MKAWRVCLRANEVRLRSGRPKKTTRKKERHHNHKETNIQQIKTTLEKIIAICEPRHEKPAGSIREKASRTNNIQWDCFSFQNAATGVKSYTVTTRRARVRCRWYWRRRNALDEIYRFGRSRREKGFAEKSHTMGLFLFLKRYNRCKITHLHNSTCKGPLSMILAPSKCSKRDLSF